MIDPLPHAVEERSKEDTVGLPIRRPSRWLAALVFLCLAPTAWGLPTSPFLTQFWHRPLALGGEPPPPWPVFERKLSASTCALCHQSQYKQWRKSRHALAMGPGVIGQLAAAGLAHPRFVRNCLSCHAPGNRQELAVKAFMVGAPLTPFARQGITCADCHVRHYQRFGPPLSAYLAAGRVVHNGFTPESDFTHSRFCASCHQFHKSGARLNGVLLENTYNEWRASPYAKDGITCQSCHMPKGRHDFYGIHNRQFVRRALTIHMDLSPSLPGHPIHATLSITNSGVGHDFPTYTTPRVAVSLQQMCGRRTCRHSTRQIIIGRSISLDLRHQYYDTRLAPGARRTLRYEVPRVAAATAVLGRIIVYPDAAYVHFFHAYLAAYALTPDERGLIERALKRDENSRYILWSRRQELTVVPTSSQVARQSHTSNTRAQDVGQRP